MKHVISTTTAPGAVGPYSQAIEANGFVFVSGQLPLDPATGAFVPGGTSEQAEQSIKNLLAVLEAAGCKAEDVVKTTVFMIDIGDFGVVNEVYGKYFSGECPARCAMQAAALPKGAWLLELASAPYGGKAVKRENQKEKGETACFSLSFCARTRYNIQITI